VVTPHTMKHYILKNKFFLVSLLVQLYYKIRFYPKILAIKVPYMPNFDLFAPPLY